MIRCFEGEELFTNRGNSGDDAGDEDDTDDHGEGVDEDCEATTASGVFKSRSSESARDDNNITEEHISKIKLILVKFIGLSSSK